MVFAIGLTAVALTSCSDSFLDKNPDERTEIDTEDKVVQLLVTSYPAGNPSWVGEMSSDNLIDNQAPHLPSSPNDKQILSHYNYSYYELWDNELFSFQPASHATYNDTDSPGYLWMNYYNSIASANFALQAVERLTKENGGKMSDKLAAAKAEALLLRAYDHFQLVNIFSKGYRGEASKQDRGIPYVKEIEDVVHKSYDRGNVADVYAKIQQDLEEALPLVSDINYTTAPKYHFNSDAAHAFAARFYLFSRQYQKAIEQADMVLGTDSASTQRKTMDYSVFENCSSADDYATQWQNPDLGNNLLLMTTYSTLSRRIFGYRYSCAGPAVQQVLMVHDSPLWSRYICPAQALVAGMTFSNSSHDYGFISTKINEKFEYSSKISGIGYAHVVYRAFTGSELLLERAEAKIMLGQYAAAAEDLKAYWNYGLASFSADDRAAYIETGYTKFLDNKTILSYWGNPSNVNCYADWNFAGEMGLNIPAEAVPYMNCLNDFRRFENSFEGMRFFDIKRWGLPLSHEIGVYQEKISTTALDERRAIEVPWETISAGLDSSRVSIPTSVAPVKSYTLSAGLNVESLVKKTKQ